jgi:hypothetical protein
MTKPVKYALTLEKILEICSQYVDYLREDGLDPYMTESWEHYIMRKLKRHEVKS